MDKVNKEVNKVKQASDRNIEKLEKNFELVTPYRTVLDTITAVCKDCGYEDTKTARTFIRSGCTNCKKGERLVRQLEKIKQDDDEYLERVNRELDEYKISHYRGYEDDILELTHIPCGRIEKIDNRYTVPTCEKCNPDKLIDADWYREAYKRLTEDGYEVVRVIYGPYTKSKSRSTSIELLHKECGNKFTRINHTLKLDDGHICPICDTGNKRIGEINEDNIDQIIKAELGEEYAYESGFTDSVEPFKLKHLKCGTVYTKRLSTIRINSGGCPKCKKERKVKRNTQKIKSKR